MKMKFLKTIAVILSAVTVMGVTAGCAGTKPGSKASSGSNNVTEKDGFFWSSKPITITMLLQDNTGYPYKDSWTFFKKLKEKTNVTLSPTVVAQSDYIQKRSVLIASGQEPEIIPKTYPGQEDPFVTSGRILPISDYLNLMPYFTKELKEWNLTDDLKTITQGDGKYYIMPGLHESFVQDYSICMRMDILKKHNIKTPETWDEFYNVLKQLKQLYPDVIPFSDRWNLGCTMMLAGPAFIKTSTGLAGVDGDFSPSDLLAFDSSTKKFSFYPTSDGYKAELQYFNKLIKEGLMDKESITQTSDQAINKFGSGKSFAISTNSQAMKNDYAPKLDATLGAGNYEIAKINVLGGPAGKYIQGSRLENGVMISKKVKDNENFETIIRFVDWLWNSYKGQEFCKWGIEGETFTKDGDTYKIKDGYCLPAYGIGDSNGIDIRKEMGFGCGNFVLSYGGPDALAHSYMTKDDIEFSENVLKTHTLLPYPPKVAYDEATKESQEMLNSQLKDYYTQATYKFILGQWNFTTDWDNYVKQFQSMGAQKYLDTANSTYAKQKK
ncbi:family 1 extracellular solute-binding protein [[Clostridium] cellulosi]|uniref:Family 1 extracellular solute-binding protein n=1 Tax=[Clostridium] cellulosi TaxID=29343 RepID=A0A078KL02_9FIRM|nr:family 1 extracellular solute-binding protein [[Clostridium] cellulosi]